MAFESSRFSREALEAILRLRLDNQLEYCHFTLWDLCVFQHTEWKSHRQAVLQCIDQFWGGARGLVQLPDSCQINRAAWERCVQSSPQPRVADDHSRAPLVFLMDDNFYYSSMRYEVYQLARKCKPY